MPAADSGAAALPTRPAGSADWLAAFTRDQRRARRRDQLLVWLYRLLMVVAVLGVWQLLEAAGVISAATVSDPAAVARYFFATLLGQGQFWQDVWQTFEEMILGLLFGVLAGTVLGVALGLMPAVASAFRPVIAGLNAVPKVALAPLAVVWLGLGIQSKVLLAALGVFFVVFFNVVGGLGESDRMLVRNVRMLGMSRLRTLAAVTLPSIGVWVVTALKVAISLALVGAIVGEYVGANSGLGYEINTAVNTVQVTRMIALLVAVGIVGAVAYAVVALSERWILRWR